MIKKSQKGFTLIELLVVISIISLLASVVLASLNSARAKARDVKRLADKRSVITALNLFYDTNNRWPTALGPSYWVCLGAPDAERCWFGGDFPAGQFAGLTTLVNSMQPYISSFPTNNANVGKLGFNRILYMDYLPDSGPGWPAGAYLTWMQENDMTSKGICPTPATNLFKYDDYWYCHEFIGSP